MFGLGVGEILVILVIALLVLGPRKLPEVARTVARGLNEFRRAAGEFQRSLDESTRLDDAGPQSYPKAPQSPPVGAIAQESSAEASPPSADTGAPAQEGSPAVASAKPLSQAAMNTGDEKPTAPDKSEENTAKNRDAGSGP